MSPSTGALPRPPSSLQPRLPPLLHPFLGLVFCCLLRDKVLVVEGDQTMSPQNLPFRPEGAFEPKATEKRQTQEELPAPRPLA